MDWMQELIRVAPALREAGVLKLGCGDKWAELAPPPPPALGEPKVDEEEVPEFGPPGRMRAYDAPGETSKP